MKDDATNAAVISPEVLAEHLQIQLQDLARLVRLPSDFLTRDPQAPEVQTKLNEVADILKRATDITGDAYKAIVWFKFDHLDALDDRTAAELVEAGRADAVVSYLELVDNGIYG